MFLLTPIFQYKDQKLTVFTKKQGVMATINTNFFQLLNRTSHLCLVRMPPCLAYTSPRQTIVIVIFSESIIQRTKLLILFSSTIIDTALRDLVQNNVCNMQSICSLCSFHSSQNFSLKINTLCLVIIVKNKNRHLNFP